MLKAYPYFNFHILKLFLITLMTILVIQIFRYAKASINIIKHIADFEKFFCADCSTLPSTYIKYNFIGEFLYYM